MSGHKRITNASAFAEAFSVSRETVDKLETYASLLRRWQKAINLVAPATVGDVWHRHFADSAQLLSLAPDTPSGWVDLGSGAGFPGLVVAIMLSESKPGRTRVSLIESDQRKCAFLREVARQTGTLVEILSTRIENTATHVTLERVEVVSARALSPLSSLLGLAAPFLAPHSVGLFPKGRDVEREIAAARAVWAFECELVASLTDSAGRIAVIRHLEAKREV